MLQHLLSTPSKANQRCSQGGGIRGPGLSYGTLPRTAKNKQWTSFGFFRLDFSWDMSNFKHRQALGALHQFVVFQTEYVEIVAKLWCFKLNMSKSIFKKSDMASFQWRHWYYITKKRHQTTSQDFPFWAPPNQNFWLACQVTGGKKLWPQTLR